MCINNMQYLVQIFFVSHINHNIRCMQYPRVLACIFVSRCASLDV